LKLYSEGFYTAVHKETPPICTFAEKQMVTIHGLQFKPFIREETILRRVEELGIAINHSYQGKELLLLGILNGSFVFMADLMRSLNRPTEIAFVKIASYSGMESTGKVVLSDIDGLSLEGKHILIVEDIIDSGLTMNRFLEWLRSQRPASIAITALFNKPAAHQTPIHIDWKGFDIPNDFVIGYGLDYNGLGRHLRDLYALDN